MSHELVVYGKGKGKAAIDDPQQKKFARRTIDYGSNVVRWLEDCLARRVPPHRLQRHYCYAKELMPPFATPQSPYDSICCRFVHSSTNKNRAPVNVVHWFPNGRRLISGTQTGEITIWNGSQFHFENILQAHNAAVRAMQWTPEETVLVSGDQLGIIKFWDQYLYNFQTFQGHKESICDITISPTGMKFCSCADDSHAKVWDLRTGEEERAFTGHGWDVKCCNWHPTKGLVATGSKDSQIKLWDPRASEAITTIFCHKNTVTRVIWSPNGQWLASGSRDQLVMLMDIRTMSVRKVFKAHQKEVTALCWHPETDALLASGGYDAAIHFWDTHGAAHPIESIPGAHEGPVWSLSWHPLGHLLVSGSHDYSTRFWSRARPGDTSWVDLLPKKIGMGANDPPLPPPPSAGRVGTIFEAGVFAEPSPPPPPVEAKSKVATLAASAEGDSRCSTNTANKSAGTQAVVRHESGLSLGEGASRKDVLDTSDFDAEDHGVLQVAQLSGAAGRQTARAGHAMAAGISSPDAPLPAPQAEPKSASAEAGMASCGESQAPGVAGHGSRAAVMQVAADGDKHSSFSVAKDSTRHDEGSASTPIAEDCNAKTATMERSTGAGPSESGAGALEVRCRDGVAAESRLEKHKAARSSSSKGRSERTAGGAGVAEEEGVGDAADGSTSRHPAEAASTATKARLGASLGPAAPAGSQVAPLMLGMQELGSASQAAPRPAPGPPCRLGPAQVASGAGTELPALAPASATCLTAEAPTDTADQASTPAPEASTNTVQEEATGAAQPVSENREAVTQLPVIMKRPPQNEEVPAAKRQRAEESAPLEEHFPAAEAMAAGDVTGAVPTGLPVVPAE